MLQSDKCAPYLRYIKGYNCFRIYNFWVVRAFPTFQEWWAKTQSECIVFLISSHDEIDTRIFLYILCAKAKLRTIIFYMVFILLYHVNVVGETTLLFGTWQQEAPYQHKGQIKILLRRVLALTYGTKLRCFLKMQDNMCIQRERKCEGYKTSQDTSKIHVPIGSI